MNCPKCDYEWCSIYLDDDGNEFVPSHYCNGKMIIYKNAEINKTIL